MKKIIGFAAVAAAAMSLAAAEISVGARGIFGLGLGTSLNKDLKDSGFKNGTDLNFGGAAFVKIPANNVFFVQPELGVTYNIVGVKMEQGDTKIESNLSYTALDILLMLGTDFKAGNFTVSPIVGPKFSILLGKPEMEMKTTMNGKEVPGMNGKDKIDVASPLAFSVAVGAGVAYKVGPGAIVGDLRYNIGVTELKMKNGDAEAGFATPRSLQISAGYQISF